MRTDAEVTAAAERTADLALRCAELTRQRDRVLKVVEAWEAEEPDLLYDGDQIGNADAASMIREALGQAQP